MKPPPTRGTGVDGGKQLDKIDASNLVCFPTTRKSISPEDATAFIREIAFHQHDAHLHRLGPRAIGEFLSEIGERHLCRTSIEDRLLATDADSGSTEPIPTPPATRSTLWPTCYSTAYLAVMGSASRWSR